MRISIGDHPFSKYANFQKNENFVGRGSWKFGNCLFSGPYVDARWGNYHLSVIFVLWKFVPKQEKNRKQWRFYFPSRQLVLMRNYRSHFSDVSAEKWSNFQITTGLAPDTHTQRNNLCWSLFFSAFSPVTLLKSYSSTGVFLWILPNF